MKLKVLVENTVFQPDAKSELGLSLFLENENDQIIFDTGQSNLFAENAKLFDIQLDKVKALILSHGHYDHTGGLKTFLALNSQAKIYVKRGFDIDRYGKNDRYVGIPKDVHIPEERLVWVDEPTEISSGIFVMPDIPILHNDDTHFSHLSIRKDGNNLEDNFADELYLAIVKDGKLSVISGCAHRGIINVIQSALSHFHLPLHLVMGGFHTLHENNAKIETLSENFNQLNIERIIPCHCTGINQYAILKEKCKAQVEYGHTGVNVFI